MYRYILVNFVLRCRVNIVQVINYDLYGNWLKQTRDLVNVVIVLIYF